MPICQLYMTHLCRRRLNVALRHLCGLVFARRAFRLWTSLGRDTLLSHPLLPTLTQTAYRRNYYESLSPMRTIMVLWFWQRFCHHSSRSRLNIFERNSSAGEYWGTGLGVHYTLCIGLGVLYILCILFRSLHYHEIARTELGRECRDRLVRPDLT